MKKTTNESLASVRRFARQAEAISQRALRESESFFRRNKKLPANVVVY